MGLDHWLYKVRKCKPSIAPMIEGMTFDDAYAALAECGESPHGFLVQDTGDDMTSDLEPYADRVTLVTFELDEEKLKRDFGIPESAFYVGGRYGNGYASMSYMDEDDNRYTAELDDSNAHDYDVPVDTPYYVCEALELRQWRKQYDIQDAVYAAHDIQNCGFHVIDDDMTLDTLEDLDENLVIPRLREGEAIVYHEWY